MNAPSTDPKWEDIAPEVDRALDELPDESAQDLDDPAVPHQRHMEPYIGLSIEVSVTEGHSFRRAPTIEEPTPLDSEPRQAEDHGDEEEG